MNIMCLDITFHGGLIRRTAYYGSKDQERGLAWLVIENRTWHFLLPGPPRSTRCIQVRPATAEAEPNGWAWLLDVDGQHYQIPADRILPARPQPPEHGGYWKKTAVLYFGQTRGASRAAFGGVHELMDGLSYRSYPLWVTAGLRVGYTSV